MMVKFSRKKAIKSLLVIVVNQNSNMVAKTSINPLPSVTPRTIACLPLLDRLVFKNVQIKTMSSNRTSL